MQPVTPRPVRAVYLAVLVLLPLSATATVELGGPSLVFPTIVGESLDPAPPLARLASGFDSGEDRCDGNETRVDYVASWPQFNLNTAPAREFSRCTNPEGVERIVLGMMYLDLFEGITTIGGLGVQNLSRADYTVAGRWAITEGFFTDASFRIAAIERTPAGVQNAEIVLSPGDDVGNGYQYRDPRFIFPFLDAGIDGLQPFFAMVGKFFKPATPEVAEIGVALCRRVEDDNWDCRLEYRVDTLDDYADITGIRSGIDPISGEPIVALGLAATFDPFIAPTVAIATGDFVGSPLDFVARSGDAVPAPGMGLYDTFTPDFGFGWNCGSFGGVTMDGNAFAAAWLPGTTDEEILAFEGDVIEGETIDQVIVNECDRETIAFTNRNEITGREQVFVAPNVTIGSGPRPVRIRGLSMAERDVLINGQRYDDTSLYRRGVLNRVAVSGASEEISRHQIPVYLIQQAEVVPGGAGAVYGSDAIAGVVNVITRDPREVLATHEVDVPNPQAVALCDSRLLMSSVDSVDPRLFEVDRSTHAETPFASTPGEGYFGFACSDDQAWGFEASIVWDVDLASGISTQIGALIDQDDQPLTNVSGAAYDRFRDGAAFLTETGGLYALQPGTSRGIWFGQLPEIATPARGLASVGVDRWQSSDDSGYTYEFEAVYSFGGGSGAGPAPPTVQLRTIIQASENPITGLAPEPVPEPSALVLAAGALGVTAALRRAGRGLTGRSVGDLVPPHRA